jgi:homoserine O-succinyltransferase
MPDLSKNVLNDPLISGITDLLDQGSFLVGGSLRDIQKGLNIEKPKNYFPYDDEHQYPPATWRGHAHLLYTNWLNYYVYQATPYDLDEVGLKH